MAQEIYWRNTILDLIHLMRSSILQVLLSKIDKRAKDHQRVELKVSAGQIGPRGVPGPMGYVGPKGFEVRTEALWNHCYRHIV